MRSRKIPWRLFLAGVGLFLVAGIAAHGKGALSQVELLALIGALDDDQSWHHPPPLTRLVRDPLGLASP